MIMMKMMVPVQQGLTNGSNLKYVNIPTDVRGTIHMLRVRYMLKYFVELQPI